MGWDTLVLIVYGSVVLFDSSIVDGDMLIILILQCRLTLIKCQ